MGFIATLVYLVMQFLRPQELYLELAQYRLIDALGMVALVGTGVSLAIGDRPRLAWQQVTAGAAFLLWSCFSIAVVLRWLGGAVALLEQVSIAFYVFFLLAFNVSSRRRLGVVVAVICLSLLALLGQCFRAYYSGIERSPFFITATARGGLDTFLESPEASPVPMADEESEPAQRMVVKRIQGLGVFSDPNDLAQALVAAIPLLFVAWRRRKLLVNLPVVLLPAAVMVWGVLLTRSRGGLLALLALLPLAVMQRLSPRSRHVATMALSIVAVPGAVFLFGYALADASALGRLEAWAAGLRMLKSSPVWGIGSGFFTDHHERVAHNSFVQCFAETGLVGYFLWLALIVLSLRQMSALSELAEDSPWTGWARAAELSLYGFLVGALFLSRTTSMMFFLLTGLTAAVASAARRDGESLPVPRSWPRQVLALEVVSILTVWLTARAVW